MNNFNWPTQTALSISQIRMWTWSSSKRAKAILKRAWFVSEIARSPLARTRRKWEKVSLCNLRNYLLRTAKEILAVVEWGTVKKGSSSGNRLPRNLPNRNPWAIISSLINNQISVLYIKNMPKIEGSTQLAKRRTPWASSARAISTWLSYKIIISIQMLLRMRVVQRKTWGMSPSLMMMTLLFLGWLGLYLMGPLGILQMPQTVNIIVKDKTSKDSIESISIILSLQLEIMRLMSMEKINCIRIKRTKITQIINRKILKICHRRSIKGTKQIIKVIKIKVGLRVTLPKPCLRSIEEELAHIIDQIPWSTKRINKMKASIATTSVLLTKTKSHLRYRRWVTRCTK